MNSQYIPYTSSPTQLADLSQSPYYSPSTESSPSPRMIYNTGKNHHHHNNTYPPLLDPSYLQRRAQQQQQQAAILASVEFTDLTAPVYEDRRRRKSTTMQDKQAISNMGIRRRAQNRASQRAFRERKEKHVQHLESELSALEAKHSQLQKSHSNLGESNAQLKAEVETLRTEIRTMRVLGEGGGFDGLGEVDGVFETVGEFPF
ncbi:MAG: hypothetical protein Q9220_005696 [cf. Caloplaca sp. 1 TL-2023]